MISHDYIVYEVNIFKSSVNELILPNNYTKMQNANFGL